MTVMTRLPGDVTHAPPADVTIAFITGAAALAVLGAVGSAAANPAVTWWIAVSPDAW